MNMTVIFLDTITQGMRLSNRSTSVETYSLAVVTETKPLSETSHLENLMTINNVKKKKNVCMHMAITEVFVRESGLHVTQCQLQINL
jgi:hypothetical protein